MNQNIKGLSSEQVNEQITLGNVNINVADISKSNIDIIKDNVFTLFNLLNLVIAIALALVKAYSNMFFFLIIIINILIGIIQEIKAKQLVEKLSLTTAIKVKVYRDGILQEIGVEEVVLNDIIALEMGDQIISDAKVMSNSIEVDESLLTGESDLVKKEKGSLLYSGSFVVSGKALVKVIKVGNDNYASQLVNEVAQHKGINSQLINAITSISKFTSFIIVPIGVILFFQAFYMREDNLKLAVIASAAALLGMLPKGLVLLISISNASAVIKLANKQVLVQEMHCMETLAYVDTICLDKTGTITKGKMQVVEFVEEEALVKDYKLFDLISLYVRNVDDNNATYLALRDYFTSNELNFEVSDKIAFSSQRKWSSLTFNNIGSILIGAPEKLLSKDKIPSIIKEATLKGSRALVVAYIDGNVNPDQLDNLTLLGCIIINDPIRDNTKETLAYFRNEGVNVKIISGDNIDTVANVARLAGLEGYNKALDLSSVSDEQLMKDALNYDVFGRVSPKQKQLIVHALQANNHTVAMSGDGVNDILALRDADVSIAMAQGNDAIKQISQLVLLDSDFASLPLILKEGRRVVNNVTKVASIFFIKTIYSLILTIMCILLSIAFPFIPTQITFIDLAIEGYPSFFLSFEDNNQKVKGRFLKTALTNAFPNALMIIFNIIMVMILTNLRVINVMQSSTVMYYLVGFTSILAVFKACLPFNKLRIFLLTTVSIGFYFGIWLFAHTLKLVPVTSTMLQIIVIQAIISCLVVYIGQTIVKKRRIA